MSQTYKSEFSFKKMSENKMDLSQICDRKRIMKANLASSYISRNKVEKKSVIFRTELSASKVRMKFAGKNYAKIIAQRLKHVGLNDSWLRRRGYSESSNYDTKQLNIDITCPIASTSQQESIVASSSPISGILFQPSNSAITGCITLEQSLNAVRGASNNLINATESSPHSRENLKEYQKDLEKIVEVLRTTQIVASHSAGDTTLDDFELSD